MTNCKHKRFLARAHVSIMEDSDFKLIGYAASLQVQCADCLQHMRFIAPNVTFSLSGLTIGKDEKNADSPDDTKLVCPIEPVPTPFVPEVVEQTPENPA